MPVRREARSIRSSAHGQASGVPYATEPGVTDGKEADYGFKERVTLRRLTSAYGCVTFSVARFSVTCCRPYASGQHREPDGSWRASQALGRVGLNVCRN
jgi:hypothetical protein